jgi:hypothetical protein
VRNGRLRDAEQLGQITDAQLFARERQGDSVNPTHFKWIRPLHCLNFSPDFYAEPRFPL